MEKYKEFLILIIGILTISIIYYLGVNSSPPNKEDILLEKINRIESKINSLSRKKDSIRTIIITVDKEIIKNEHHYEKVVNDIIHQPDSINRIFTNDYIERYIDRIRKN